MQKDGVARLHHPHHSVGKEERGRKSGLKSNLNFNQGLATF